MYEFSVNGTDGNQRSNKYGKIALKRCKMRQNKNSSEILLVWEQEYSKLTKTFFNATLNATQEKSTGAAQNQNVSSGSTNSSA